MNIDRRYWWAVAGLALILVFAGGMKYAEMRMRDQNQQQIISDPGAGGSPAASKPQGDILQVYVTGAVTKPGVYRLEPGARVFQAIDMAGSLPTANLKNINLASKLEDGQAIIVPAVGEENSGTMLGGAAGLGSSASNPSAGGKVNINSASVQELDEKLPGVGPAIAQRIVDYRTSQGAFSKIEDLTSVSGIGDKKFVQIKDLVTVR